MTSLVCSPAPVPKAPDRLYADQEFAPVGLEASAVAVPTTPARHYPLPIARLETVSEEDGEVWLLSVSARLMLTLVRPRYTGANGSARRPRTFR